MKKYDGRQTGKGLLYDVPKERHVDKASVVHFNKEELHQKCLAEGYVWHDGEPWINSWRDELLEDCIARDNPSMEVGEETLIRLGRSYDGGRSQLHSLIIRLGGDRGAYARYQPLHRTDRTGLPLNQSEYGILLMVTAGAGLDYGAF